MFPRAVSRPCRALNDTRQKEDMSIMKLNTQQPLFRPFWCYVWTPDPLLRVSCVRTKVTLINPVAVSGDGSLFPIPWVGTAEARVGRGNEA